MAEMFSEFSPQQVSALEDAIGLRPVMHDLTYEQKLRIEALRAAARIMASIISVEDPHSEMPEATILLAKQFHRYLESGDG